MAISTPPNASAQPLLARRPSSSGQISRSPSPAAPLAGEDAVEAPRPESPGSSSLFVHLAPPPPLELRRNYLAERSQSTQLGVAVPPMREPGEVDTHDLLDRGYALLQAKAPRAALALLKPFEDTTLLREHYAFANQLGDAYMRTADLLRDANLLGATSVLVGGSEHGPQRLINERLTAYLGVMRGHGHCMQILDNPERRAYFISRNSEETLAQLLFANATGLHHAMCEGANLINNVAQVNMNLASEAFIERALQTGLLAKDDRLVIAHARLKELPLFAQIQEATAAMAAEVHTRGVDPHRFWIQWHDEALLSFAADPAFRLAAKYAAAPAPELSWLSLF